MKKTVMPWIAAAGLFGLSSMAAAEGGIYLGGGALKGSGETTWEDFSSSTAKHDNSGVSFKLGTFTSAGNRVEVSYSKLDEEFKNGVKAKISGFDLDFIAAFGSGSVKPLLGIGVGMYTWADTAQYYTSNEDRKGVALNLQAGISLELTQNFEIEATYRYRAIAWQDVENGPITETTKTNNGDLYAGILIKF